MDVASEHEAHLGHLTGATQAFAATLDRARWDLPVPSCPGWLVRDVVWHLGGIHRWATTAVLEARAAEETHAGPPDEELRDWYAAAAGDLVTALRNTPTDAEVWAFGPEPRRVTFWSRRQVHETNVHLWDLRNALGEDATAAYPADTAADGVDEALTMFLPRQLRLGRIPPVPGTVDLVGTEGQRWRIGEGEPQATITGATTALLLLVWRRLDLTDPALDVTGDEEAARAVVGAGLTP